VLAKAASDDKLTVCIDEVYAGLSNNDQCEVLFGADGVVTPFLKRVLEFLQTLSCRSAAHHRLRRPVEGTGPAGAEGDQRRTHRRQAQHARPQGCWMRPSRVTSTMRA
jgi:hypothetical protein